MKLERLYKFAVIVTLDLPTLCGSVNDKLEKRNDLGVESGKTRLSRLRRLCVYGIRLVLLEFDSSIRF